MAFCYVWRNGRVALLSLYRSTGTTTTRSLASVNEFSYECSLRSPLSPLIHDTRLARVRKECQNSYDTISPSTIMVLRGCLHTGMMNTCMTYRSFSTDNTDSTDVHDELLAPNLKIEKQLMKFMDMWEMHKAIKLLRLSVQNNIIPHQTVILNLLQQLANLGEVDFLVEMHQFLLDEKLCSNTAFYMCLQQAYFNSGRIDEGVDFLRKIYHLTRKYQDIDTYFVLLTVMILRHFPDKEPMIKSVVTDLAQRVPSDHEVRAGLWKCYMLMGNFTKADDLVQEFGKDMKPFLPIMVNDICLQRNKVDQVDRKEVLANLLDFPGLGRKQQALLYQTYIFLLVEEAKYKASLLALNKARQQDVVLKKEAFLPVIQVLKTHVAESSEGDEQESLESVLTAVKTWLEGSDN
ncbi:uncharacterized protein LOC135465673 [Liolophura sinensis]|uniref:uncharacterized protein LOC135465673 n=1 Tax=Liolophura sinensis TaxID=3198878 RepID=UPI0031594578